MEEENELSCSSSSAIAGRRLSLAIEPAANASEGGIPDERGRAGTVVACEEGPSNMPPTSPCQDWARANLRVRNSWMWDERLTLCAGSSMGT